MKVIGIDPGLSGAIAFIDDESGDKWVCDMPVYTVKEGKGSKRHLDRRRLISILGGVVDLVVIETQQAYPDQGAVSNFSTGFGYGVLLMLLDWLKHPYEVVHPKKWQREFWSTPGKTKGKSTEIATRLFPDLELRGPKGGCLDGRSDALLMAEYGRRRIVGGNHG